MEFSVGNALGTSFRVWFRNFLPFTLLNALLHLPLLAWLASKLKGPLTVEKERSLDAVLAATGSITAYLLARHARVKSNPFQNNFRAIFDSNVAGIFIKDRNGHILEANTAFLKLLKYQPADLRGLRSCAVIAKEFQSLEREKDGEAMTNGACKPWRSELITKDGGRVAALLGTASLEDSDGGSLTVVLDASGFDELRGSLEELAGRILNVYDDERRGIARELHDTTAQNLAALSMNLTMLSGVIEDRQRASAILAECNSLTDECLKEVRSLSYMLHPPLLDELGLTFALRSFVELFERRTGVSVDLAVGGFPRLRSSLELGLFRVAQEALFNVHRHAGTKKAEVTIAASDTEVEVTVRDWGKGIPSDAILRNTLGIAGMRERVRSLGGRLEVGPADPGTLVHAVFPLER